MLQDISDYKFFYSTHKGYCGASAPSPCSPSPTLIIGAFAVTGTCPARGPLRTACTVHHFRIVAG